jgi:lipopolysaccharide/colanic/teichoic acid biosynthesis glycosyltransferase
MFDEIDHTRVSSMQTLTHGKGKSRKDPSVTRVGAFLRRYSLDELPQLLYVLKGEMSIVGPRPLTDSDFDLLPATDFFACLLCTREMLHPGLTGLWQISGRSDLSLQQMIMLDHYYAEKQSLAFDVEILAHTIPAVFTARGAF